MPLNEWEKASIRDAEVERLYSDEVAANIADVIKPFVSQQAESEFTKRIRDWAGGYLGLRELDRERGLERATTKKLTALAQRAEALAEAIDALDADVVKLLAYEARTKPGPGDVPTFGSVLLGEPVVVDRPAMQAQLIEVRAQCHKLNRLSLAHIDALSPKPGRKRDRARRVAVAALGSIFWESTGQVPTREIDRITSQPKSRFHLFCMAALKPIHGKEAATGLDSIIRDSMA